MQKIAIASKRRNSERFAKYYRSVYNTLKKAGKEVYLEAHIADVLKLKKVKKFTRGKTAVDMIVVMGGDGTILSVIRHMHDFNVLIFGINLGTLGFLSEIPPIEIAKKLALIFKGDYRVDRRPMITVEVRRGGRCLRRLHAVNEAVISHGAIVRLIKLRTRVDRRKLTTYHADGLIIATPTGSTAYSLSAGGPIVHPAIQALILTPINPHSFTQKPIVIPKEKKIEITVESENCPSIVTVDGQESVNLKCGDVVKIKSDGNAQFIRLPGESFFKTLRQKLHWGKKVDK